MIPAWTFKGYVTASGKRAVVKWYDSQSAEVRAEFDTVVEYLMERPRGCWGMPEFKLLSGKHSKLGELRFDVRKVEYRPLGFFGPDGGEFTLLIGASKKGRNYTPREALDTALDRRDEVIKDRGRIHDWVNEDTD